MIENFDFKRNREKCIALLQYNKLLEKQYIPNASQSIEFGGVKIAEDGVGCDDTQLAISLSESQQLFAKRYNEKVLPSFLDYDDYLGNGIIQKLVNGLSLDKDKFWFFILFVYDYSVNQCLGAPLMRNSVEEQIYYLQEKIQSYLQGSNQAPFTLTFCVGKKKDSVVVNNALALSFISEAIAEKLEIIPLGDDYETVHHEMSEEIVDMTDCVFLTYFSKMFLNLFDLLPEVKSKRKKGARYSQKEKDLVCQLIYFAHISRNKSWLVLENENLKTYLKKYDRQVNTFNKIYPIFNI